MATQLSDLLQGAYSRSAWLAVYEYLFPKVSFYKSPTRLDSASPLIESFYQIGSVETADGKIALYEVEVKSHVNLQRNRVGLNNIISQWIGVGSDYAAAIGIFYQNQCSPDNPVGESKQQAETGLSRIHSNFRFTFVRKTASIDEAGAVTSQRTHTKRYTLMSSVRALTTARHSLASRNFIPCPLLL